MGVPVFGGELAVQLGSAGLVSVFGTLYENIGIDVAPALSGEAAERVVAAQGFLPFGRNGRAELVVLPREDGSYVLAYKVRAMREFDVRIFFVDARSGAIVQEMNDVQTQAAAAVGTGTGVLGDRKKVSAHAVGSLFAADDQLRPPRLATYDFRGNLQRLFSVADFYDQDLAVDSDNTWTDGANVDAHTYSGYTYDYFFKRFGRRGLDGADLHVRNITHPVRRADVLLYPASIITQFYVNASYRGDGIMIYGEGIPDQYTFDGQHWNYLAGALDVVAHELTHGVTDYSSQLIYQNESGALNESFSDVMAVSVEFYFQPDKADYLLGEDVITPGGLRSLARPADYGDPDHYSLIYRGAQDNGGVHTNSGVPNHAFYLAIEGGTNRVSGLRVTGVGSANREQIEKVFYRAFTGMLPKSATFATARAATIQSARDLYGSGSAAVTAVTQAWTAVGVN